MPDAVRAPAHTRPAIVAAAGATCLCLAYLGGTLVRGDTPAGERSAAGRAPVRAPAAIDGPSLRPAAALPAGLKGARVVRVRSVRRAASRPAHRTASRVRATTIRVASRRPAAVTARPTVQPAPAPSPPQPQVQPQAAVQPTAPRPRPRPAPAPAAKPAPKPAPETVTFFDDGD
jgi:hypothetical protein